MSLITTLPDKLCTWFSGMSEFSDCSFCTQFPSGSKAIPLEKPVIVFGIDSFSVFDNTTDETGSIITDSRTGQVKFSVGIHIPRNQGGIGCCSLLDRITDLILFDTSLEISNLQTENTEYVRNTDSLYLRAVFTTKETIHRGSKYPEPLKA